VSWGQPLALLVPGPRIPSSPNSGRGAVEAELDELAEVEPLLDTGAATGVEFPV
jgi:hypothetical protein